MKLREKRRIKKVREKKKIHFFAIDHFSRGFSRGTARFAETRARLADSRGNLHTAMPSGNSTTSTQT